MSYSVDEDVSNPGDWDESGGENSGHIDPYAQEYNDDLEEYAELPKDILEKPISGKQGFSGFGAYDVENELSISLEDSDDDLSDPDPAFVVNETAMETYRQRIREEDEKTKRGNLLALITQEKKKQRLLEIYSKDKALLTNQEKQAVKLIRRKKAGFPTDNVLVEDKEHVLSIPTKTPYQKRVDAFLGESRLNESCFGCSFGIGYITVEKDVLDALADFIVKTWFNGDAMIQAVLISQHYEQTVRTVVNQNYAGRGKPLPYWSSRDVYDCLSRHKLNNPYLWIIATLRQLTEDQIYLQDIKYSYPSSIIEHNKRPNNQHLQLNIQHQREYRETIKLRLQILKLDPKTLFGADSGNLDFSKTGTAVITAKQNIFKGSTQLRLTDMTKINRRT